MTCPKCKKKRLRKPKLLRRDDFRMWVEFDCPRCGKVVVEERQKLSEVTFA
jgi:ssDNA-binding Zn-finger/Zn-ribbon topoisomerase 1